MGDIKVHLFDSTFQAFHWTEVTFHPETQEPIEDGDVLVVASEGIIGFSLKSFAVAVVYPGWDRELKGAWNGESPRPSPGYFHLMAASDREDAAVNKYTKSIQKAIEVAESDADITGNEHWRAVA